MTFKTQQEDFWAGKLATKYINRNDALHVSNLFFFVKALIAKRGVKDCIGSSANIDMNLKVFKLLCPISCFLIEKRV